MLGAGEQPAGKAPRTRICYICGRQYGINSYEIHLKQCKDLWIQREEQKPLKDRKKLPEDPALQFGTSFPSIKSGTSKMTLDETNALAASTYNSVALEKCEYCGRTFLAEKLVIHNRSCTAEHPARRLDESVRRGRPDDYQPSPSETLVTSTQSTRPATSGGGIKAAMRSSGLAASDGAPPRRASAGDGVEPVGGDAKDKKIAVMMRKIETMESTIFDLTQALSELKRECQSLKR